MKACGIRIRSIDTFRYAAGKGIDVRRTDIRQAGLYAQRVMKGCARLQTRRFLQHLRHAYRQPVRLFAAQAGTLRQRNARVPRDAPHRRGEGAYRTVVVLKAQKPSADVQTAVGNGLAPLKHRHVGRAAADV